MLIDVKQVLKSKLGDKTKFIPAFAVNYLIRLIHQNELNDIIIKNEELQGVDFMNAVVSSFNINLNIKNEENLPDASGRYIFASNHPLGGLDGICLSAIIGNHYDKKIKYLVNDLLLFIPNLQSIFVPVNKHGAQNRDAVKKTDEAYSSDNQIITFPAGLCSRKQHGIIGDLEWKKSFIQKAIEYERNVVPIYFEGGNSNFFYRFANFRKQFGIKFNIEMLLLPDEMFKNKNKIFNIVVGKPISWQSLKQNKKPAEWAQEIKNTVYELADKK
jgi:putative hemolysin